MNMIDFRRKCAQREKSGYIRGAAKRKRRKPTAKSWYFESWYKWKYRNGGTD